MKMKHLYNRFSFEEAIGEFERQGLLGGRPIIQEIRQVYQKHSSLLTSRETFLMLRRILDSLVDEANLLLLQRGAPYRLKNKSRHLWFNSQGDFVIKTKLVREGKCFDKTLYCLAWVPRSEFGVKVFANADFSNHEKWTYSIEEVVKTFREFIVRSLKRVATEEAIADLEKKTV
jgi:hypothetical protein